MSTFYQYNYPPQLYTSELNNHNQSLEEYSDDVYSSITQLLESNKPNLDLYKQQPYLTFSIRLKLIDFLLKMSIRLKILPFVLFKAVKIFDRYCSKRIVLLDQSQLIITTCLWVASKIQGGNNHFVNLNNLDKLTSIRTINDLGYGSGGKYLGPTERFRLPKLHELVKLCGAKCKYDQGMFKQMELHVLTTLDWSLNDPSIEEFIVSSREFSIVPGQVNELFKVKEYLLYVVLYSFELIDVDLIEMSEVVMSLINEVFGFVQGDANFQVVNSANLDNDLDFDSPPAFDNFSSTLKGSFSTSSKMVTKTHLIKSIINSSDFILKLFNSKGPQYLYKQIILHYSNETSMTPRKRSITSPTSILDSPITIKNSPYQYQMNTPPPRCVPPNYSPKVFKNKYRSPKYKLPIQATSQASLNSSGSHEDIFEFDYRRGVNTPVSENELPVFVK